MNLEEGREQELGVLMASSSDEHLVVMKAFLSSLLEKLWAEPWDVLSDRLG